MVVSHDTVSVSINGGTIVGKRQPASRDYPKAVDVFYGIPYATVERFQPAVPVNPPVTTLEAHSTRADQPCPTTPQGSPETPLTLNVFRTAPRRGTTAGDAGDDDDRAGVNRGTLPVIVYFHGGAFNFGDPLERDFASLVAWAPTDVLVVTASYRLGVLGFLAGGSDGLGQTANLGLRDQRLAFEWVKHWAGAFGALRDGEVGHHLLCPVPLPSHAKSILESGSPTARSVLSSHHPRPVAQLASLRRHAAARHSETSLVVLPLKDLLDAGLDVWADNEDSVCWPFQPVVDGPGGVVPRPPLALWADFVASGRAEDHSVITGFCSNEGTQFVPVNAATNDEFLSFFHTLIPALSADDLARLETLYPDPTAQASSASASPKASMYANPPGCRHGAQFTRLQTAYGHYAYVCPVLHTAHTLALAGARAVYLYEYAALSSPFAAASHGDQAPVVDHDMALLLHQPGLQAVANAMNSRWITFAAAPDGMLDEALWPPFETPFADGPAAGDGRLLVFGGGNDEAAGGVARGTPVATRTLTDAEKEQCRFWWQKMELSQGMCVRASS
ncbi:hypothetical protein RJ55_01054 [Drechmeria coniospora]|nr:hypothetical protein RJ55_01054 [Drechmeria coniospora]